MSDSGKLIERVQLSEFADWLTPDLERLHDSPLPFAGAHDPTGVPPRAWLDGERLCYELSPIPGTGRLTRETDRRGMVNAFIRLADARPVLRFAERYGVLGICEHRYPYPHTGGKHGRLCWPRESNGEGFCWEPISVWLNYARQARGLLTIALTLLEQRPSAKAAWLDVYAGSLDVDEQAGLPVQYGRKYEQAMLSRAVDRWLAQGRPVFSLTWRQTVPALEITAGTFGILALQLAVMSANKRGLALCDECGQPYGRSGRMPRRGARNFCRDCGKKASDRQSKRRSRA